jgi:hypothetical protein
MLGRASALAFKGKKDTHQKKTRGAGATGTSSET